MTVRFRRLVQRGLFGIDSFDEPGECVAGGPPDIEVLGGVAERFVLPTEVNPIRDDARELFLSEQVHRDVLVTNESSAELLTSLEVIALLAEGEEDWASVNLEANLMNPTYAAHEPHPWCSPYSA
jgi:hypothetical protein